jgi:hypothetical protein
VQVTALLARITDLLEGRGQHGRRICKAAGDGFAKRIHFRTAAHLKASISFLCLLFLSLASITHATPGIWSDFATVSMTNPTTPKLTSNGICYSDGTDILCDGTGGLVSAAGSIATDTIISGTTKVTANTTGYISFTTAGTTTGYMDTAGNFILPGVSATGPISGTNGYFSGTLTTGNTAVIGNNLYVGSNFVFNSTSSRTLTWGNAFQTTMIGDPTNKYISLTPSGTEAMRIVSTGYVGIGTTTPSSTLDVSGSGLIIAQFSNNSQASATINRALIRLANGTSASKYLGANNSGDFSVYASDTQTRLFTISDGGSNNSSYMFARNKAIIGFTAPGGQNPSATLHVMGSTLTTSWTGINFSDPTNVTPTAPLEVSGTISATRFVGDGSGLTGIVAAANGDNIASGTTRVTANTSGYVSFTTGGTTTGYMDTAGNFILPGISLTAAGISSTNGYFTGNVGIGLAPNSTYSLRTSAGITAGGLVQATTFYTNGLGSASSPIFNINSTANGIFAPTANSFAITVSSTEAMRIVSTGYVGIGTSAPNAKLEVNGTTSATNFAAAGTGSVASNSYAWSGDTGTGLYHPTTGAIGFSNSGIEAMRITTNRKVGIGITTPSATLHVSGTAIITSWTGINFDISNVTPTAPLEVSGTVSATRFVGDGSGLTGIVGASSGDNIASGTTKVTANTSGYVSFTTAGTTTGYMDTAGNFILPGISLTAAGISSTNGYFSGNLTSAATVQGLVVKSQGSVYLGASGQQSLFWTNPGMAITGDAGSTAKYIMFITSNTEAMRIVSTGYVGIGTSAPSTTLHVSGTSTFTALATFGNNITANGGQIQIGNSNGYFWNTRSNIKSPADGIIALFNNLSSDFTRLQFGGTSSTFAALGSISGSTPSLKVTAADGTGSANLAVSGSVQVGGTGAETCSTPADYGKNRYNPVTGHMQVCVPR